SERLGAGGARGAHPPARRERRLGAGALGLLLRSGLRAGAPRARARRTPWRHGVRDRQRRHPLDVRWLVPPRLPDGRPRHRGALLVHARVEPGPGRHGVALREPGGPRGGRADRAAARCRRRGAGGARRHRGGLRREPVVEALL
ncbi:MAG: Methyltransferase type 11, partial [uncultured Nocardioides sp.]